MAGNIADLLRGAAVRHPEAPALITGSGRWTWAQLDRAADAGAADLIGRGLVRGDRLLLHLPSSIESLVALFAGARADLILVPIDPSRADAAQIAAKLAAGAVVSIEQTGFDQAHFIGISQVTGWLTVPDPAQVKPVAGGEDIAILARASQGGRAVMLSHRSLLAATDMVLGARKLNLTSRDRVLLILPLFHLAGFVTAFLPLTSVGAAGVLADTPAVTGPNVVGTGAWSRFSAAVLEAIHEQRVTVVPGAPALYRLLLRSDKLERSLSPVRLLTSAASPLNPEDAAAMLARTGSPVWEGYGISEAASVVSSSLMTEHPRLRSVGLPLPGVEIRIDPGDNAIADSPDDDEADPLASLDLGIDPGRIWVRGANLFSGYWPDGTGGPDEDGWFATTDIGYLDSHGELHLIDRAAETVTIAGFTVYPGEVEMALLTHPFVRDAAVVGLPGRAGTNLLAAIVAADGTHPTDADLTEHVTALLPPFKRPSSFHVLDILPRTELGRLDREAVRADLAAATGVDLAGHDLTSARLTVVAVPRAAAGGPDTSKSETTKSEASKPETGSSGAAESAGAQPADGGAAEQSVSATSEGAAPSTETSPPLPLPEVIDVSQLDALGSRLPGIAGRSRRSALDTDSDLFGDEVLGGEDR